MTITSSGLKCWVGRGPRPPGPRCRAGPAAKRPFGCRERSCQHQWFLDFPFLHYDVARDVVLCHTCRTAVQQKKILQSKRPDPAFVSSLVLCPIMCRTSEVDGRCVHLRGSNRCELAMLLHLPGRCVGRRSRIRSVRILLLCYYTVVHELRRGFAL